MMTLIYDDTDLWWHRYMTLIYYTDQWCHWYMTLINFDTDLWWHWSPLWGELYTIVLVSMHIFNCSTDIDNIKVSSCTWLMSIWIPSAYFFLLQSHHISTAASKITGKWPVLINSFLGLTNKKKNQSSTSLALCEGNPPVTGGFPSQRPVMTEVFPCQDIFMYQQQCGSRVHFTIVFSFIPIQISWQFNFAFWSTLKEPSHLMRQLGCCSIYKKLLQSDANKLNTVRWNFHRNWIVSEKSLVKWSPWPTLLQCLGTCRVDKAWQMSLCWSAN